MRLALLAVIVSLSAVVHADQQGDERDRFVTATATLRMLASASQAGQPGSLSITVYPADPTHTRLAIKGESGGTWFFESAAVSMTYTADGLIIDMRNGSVSMANTTTPFQTMRLRYKDGVFVWMDLKGAPRQ
jgi:hypothetical protein